MAIVSQAEYTDLAPTLKDHQYSKLRCDVSGNLLTRDASQFTEPWNYNYGTGSTYGLATGAVANAGKIYVALDCSDFPVSGVDWAIQSDAQYTYQLFRSHQNELTASIVFTDTTAVDNNDPVILNGITFTAKTSGAVAASHEYNLGADNGAAATNFAAAVTAHVPGVSAVSVAGAGIDTVTLTCTDATCLQFSRSTTDANEMAYTDNTLASLWTHAAVSANQAANNTTRGIVLNQSDVNGWEWCFLCLTNTSGGAAATFEVRALRY
jgi:hypothetical protein